MEVFFVQLSKLRRIGELGLPFESGCLGVVASGSVKEGVRELALCAFDVRLHRVRPVGARVPSVHTCRASCMILISFG